MRILSLLVALLFLTQPLLSATKGLETQHWTTKKGAHVIFYPAMEVPMLDISIAFAAGSAYDENAFGLSALTTRLLNQGSKGMNAETLAEKLAETGAQYDASSNQDMVVVNLKTLTNAEALGPAAALFTDIVSHPDFTEAEFNQEKSQQLMAITETKESPDSVASQTFYQMLYKDHPYAHPVLGTEEHIKALKVEQVHDFYQKFFVNRNALVVLVGAIDRPMAERLAEQITKDLPEGQEAKAIPTANDLTEAIDVEVKFSTTQTILRLGQLGITHHNPDYTPLMVGNYILGGGALVSQLSHELREKRGLTYGVSSQFYPMPGKGPFIISLTTKNSHAKTAIDITHQVLAAFVKQGPTEEELLAAQRYLTGSFPLSLASNRSIADMLIKIAFYHLPDDYLQSYVTRVNAVTKEDIKTAFQHLIMPNKLLQITVGKNSPHAP